MSDNKKEIIDKKKEIFFSKVKEDRKWYMNNFLKIRNKKGQLVNFHYNSAQEYIDRLINECEREGKLKRFIVLKARQLGVSTFFTGTMFHDTATQELKNTLIIAHEDKATQNLFSMQKLYYDELPDFIRPMKRYSNEKSLSFENPTNDGFEKKENPGLRSKITVATANTIDTGRSATFHNVHASEVAFFPDAKRTMLAILQCVPDEMNTMVVLESTANGVGDYFHDMWDKAVKGENEFIPIFLAWFVDPTYTRLFKSDEEKKAFVDNVNVISIDSEGKEVRTYEYMLKEKYNLTYEQLNWRKWCINNKCGGDEELFRQEYPSEPEEAFITSGRPRFNINSLRKYQTLTKKPIRRGYLEEKDGSIMFKDDKNGYISIWKEPKPDTFYCIGADVAEGLIDGDYSCGLVGDEDFEVVANWYGHIDPDLFGNELIKLAMYYNNAYIGVENNNHGLTTLKAIQHKEYWNIYYQKTYDRMTEEITQKMGWSTNGKTKPMMIDKLAEFLREMYVGVYWDVLVSEAFTYVIEENGSTNAQQGCHDDTIMACAILLQLLLEGKGDNYVPEIPFDQTKEFKRMSKNKEVVDSLFEKESCNAEVAE